jgi:RNA polymerase primary sigma factor
VHFPRGADDLLATLRTQGLDVLDGDARPPGPTLEEKPAKEAEDIDLALTPRTPEADSDPMRIYLREMGASSLLTREGEVDIAKRIERGQMSAPCDPPGSGHWRRLETWPALD